MTTVTAMQDEVFLHWESRLRTPGGLLHVINFSTLTMLLLFGLIGACVSATAEDNAGTNHNGVDRVPCTCRPVIYISPPKNDKKDIAALSMQQRLEKLTRQVGDINSHMKQRLRGVHADMEQKLGVIREEIQNCSTRSDTTDLLHDKDKYAIRRDRVVPQNISDHRIATPRDCASLQKAGAKKNGVYKIFLDNEDINGTLVYCDLTTAGGGWTVFQRRQDGSVNFFRNWKAYQQGFGEIDGEFWLGNDNLHRLTENSGNRLRIDLEDWGGQVRYANYGYFYVEDSNNGYRLTVFNYDGNAGDSLSQYSGQYFSTKDHDMDSDKRNCAETYKGSWWYNSCQHVSSNLNGPYVKSVPYTSVFWKTFQGVGTSKKRVTMKLRPYSFSMWP